MKQCGFHLALRSALTLSLLFALPAATPAVDEPAKKPADEITPRAWLVLKPVGRYGRSPLRLDALEAQIVAGKLKAPTAGEKVGLPGAPAQVWEKATADKNGAIQHIALRGG